MPKSHNTGTARNRSPEGQPDDKTTTEPGLPKNRAGTARARSKSNKIHAGTARARGKSNKIHDRTTSKTSPDSAAGPTAAGTTAAASSSKSVAAKTETEKTTEPAGELGQPDDKKTTTEPGLPKSHNTGTARNRSEPAKNRAGNARDRSKSRVTFRSVQ